MGIQVDVTETGPTQNLIGSFRSFQVLFGRRKGSDVRLVSAQSIDGGHKVQVVLERSEEVVEFVIPSPGLHLALDACAAASIATYLGVPLALFGKSFSKFIPVHGRSELEIAENGIKVVNDTYNASPDSTRSAIDLLRAIECKGRKVAILGDMLELGPKEIMFHELILQHCVDARIDLVALVGKRFLTAAENLNIGQEMKLVCAYDADELASRFSRNLHWDDVVLVKGSRGMQMEKIISFIKSCVLVSHIRTF
ncbi:UDP-N-acetylmuramoyl-tripeptide--D-alanyl-D-alanine ligase [Forsythia ovata]|uniref:UDP-N-acetylmuramoyl-tripeptide--D-alanyl-D-alanine ligase n=1 Tax=Forsythia ovata TaxID=205694 RepID=A0ABD1W801_9LAMI